MNTPIKEQHLAVGHYFIDTSEITISVFEWGSEYKSLLPTLVLIHATGFHARCWDQVVKYLGKRHILAIDLRGHGQSDNTPIVDWRAFGQDVDEVLTRLDIENAVGIGHSMGGFTACYSAYLNQDLFSQIILIDPAIMSPDSYRRDNNPIAVAAGEQHPVGKRRNTFSSVEEMFTLYKKRPPFNTFDQGVLSDYCKYGLTKSEGEHKFQLASPPAFEASVYQKAAFFKDIHKIVESISLPITIIRAMEPESLEDQRSFMYSPTWPDLAAKLPSGKDIHLPDASHLVPMQNPKRIADLILSEIKYLGDLDNTENVAPEAIN
jgi:lipase